MDPNIETLIVNKAVDRGLPAQLVAALVTKESSGNQWAWNPEPRYRYLWDVKANKPFRKLTEAELLSKFPPKDFPAPAGVDPDAEWWGQQSSWGYLQVMGAVAREHGYTGKFLGGLYDPDMNFEFGCRHLAWLAKRYLASAGWPGVVAAYNAGSPRVLWDGIFENQAYVDQVKTIMGGVWPQ